MKNMGGRYFLCFLKEFQNNKTTAVENKKICAIHKKKERKQVLSLFVHVVCLGRLDKT